MTAAHGWYPVFLREMLLFKHKLLRVGYVASAMVTPLIYLATFGLGLGRNVTIDGSTYIAFLIPGLAAMTSMNNSYSWMASTLNISRIYYRTFQVLVQAPIHASSILFGEILSGMVKGLFASALIVAAGFVAVPRFSISPIFTLALLLNCFLFACLGVIVGMRTASHEDTGTYSNFLVMPMAFLCGTFFQTDRLPYFLKAVVYAMPLTHTNILIRKTSMDGQAWASLAVLVFYAAVFFFYGSALISRYDE
jgi:ABC-type multidrug transport system permease subunit